MKYLSLNSDDIALSLAQAIHGREVEHFHYELNAINYQEMLSAEPFVGLANDWPVDIKQFKHLGREDLVRACLAEKPDRLKEALCYYQRDRLRHLLACEEFEAGNVERIYKMTLNRISQDELLPAIERARELRMQHEASRRGMVFIQTQEAPNVQVIGGAVAKNLTNG